MQAAARAVFLHPDYNHHVWVYSVNNMLSRPYSDKPVINEQPAKASALSIMPLASLV